MESTRKVHLSELFVSYQGVFLTHYIGQVGFPFKQNVPQSSAQTVGESDDSIF